ncbi:DegT/DnrJ/EryC1/StrS family aminotransferase [Lentilitoribacter sp. Alg239-R112]|jgi:dTDP-4-amino-4,6-dideoxygalactose transaminase|uniref:DegT/DnrJ/EryC1/StrS family aminotransferase n=1 Tax=Lentilitoribacter sp. Alg239-R112 TaxID=2305987 RepID=UPI0013A6CBA8|nr:DegT/DnrJ/EryC1/StrS family aminotransferase [Lentilitoribacter sp. Alg239-R112]
MTDRPNIPFVDLAAQQNRIRKDVDIAMARVLDHGRYIMGPEVGELEEALAKYCGAKHAIGCSSGTDALAMVLMAKSIKPGQIIFCPSFTFVATAEVVAWLGAKVCFVDVEPDTFNIDPKALQAAIIETKANGMDLAGIISVDLFGLPVAHQELDKIATEHDLWILSDAAQSFGARYNNKPVGTMGLATTTSFFPAKPLGAYGDGGAMFTDDDQLAEELRSILFHGMGKNQYDNVRIGMTGRLDTMQAAVLLEKLKIFEDEIETRQKVAGIYTDGLKDLVTVPHIPHGRMSVWAQYTTRLPEGIDRAQLQEYLTNKGIPTAVYYAKPLHRQEAYGHNIIAGGELPITDALSKDVLSLPMHPYLDAPTQEYIIEHIDSALKAQS